MVLGLALVPHAVWADQAEGIDEASSDERSPAVCPESNGELTAIAASSSLAVMNLGALHSMAIASPELSPPEVQTASQLAQQSPDPNSDRFLQPLPEPLPPVSPVDPPEVEPAPVPAQPSPSPSDTLIPVRQIEVVGSTVFTPSDFAPLVEPLEGQSVSLDALQDLSDAITQLYLDAGYITSRAILIEQQVTNGVVQIQIIEGQISEIEIQGAERVNQSYIRDRIRLGARTPVRTDDLEDQLRLLRIDPLFENIEASLRAGEAVGESILVVRVEEASPWTAEFGVDNYSPPIVGSERLRVAVANRNLTGNGDRLSASWTRTTTGGSVVYDFGYRIPLNAREGTLQLRSVIERNEIPLSSTLDVEGNSELYEVSFRQPLVRTPREEFALSLGFTHKDGQTFLGNIPFGFSFGPDANGVSRTSVFRFGQDYIRRDAQGAWAVRSQFSFGTDLLDATVNPSPIPDSRFFSWLAQGQRVQRLGEDQLLILQADLQLTPDSLLSSEQFVIGGGQSLRGYRQNVRAGDNGFRLSIEDRITIQRDEAGDTTLQIAPFADVGAVWNDPDNPNSEGRSDRNFLAGLGLGILWEPLPDLNIRVDYGIPLINIPDKGNNTQDEGFYFSVNYRL